MENTEFGATNLSIYIIKLLPVLWAQLQYNLEY